MIRVYDAIKQGRRQLLLIPSIISGVGVSALLIAVLNGFFEAPIIAFICGLLFCLGISLAWKYYHFSRWLVWAYTHVHDVHGLDARAKTNGLLSPTNYYYKKTKIKLKGEKEVTTIRELLKREKNPEILLDRDLPHVLRVKKVEFSDMLFFLIGGMGLLLAIASKNIFLLIIVAFILLLLESIQDKFSFRDTESILTLSAEGVVFKETHLPWEKIKKWAVVDRKQGSYFKTYLEIKTTTRIKRKREMSFEVSDLDISRNELEYCMDVYHTKYRIINKP